MSKLECTDFTVKYFGYDAAISGVTTNFFDGINVIYAAEKSGKTSFLKGIAGIAPHSGEVLLDGEDLFALSPKERDVQMVFDDYALFTRHSARYNLEYPLKLRKVSKAERRERAEKAAALFDLDLMIDAPVYRLNEWHKVSLVLCRAYLRQAKVLLIDNVFSRLDAQSRREAFLRYLPLFGKDAILIYATDDPFEAQALSREIKFLSCGYLLQEGAPNDFVKTPSCLPAFSAFSDFTSVLPCTVNEKGVSLFGKEYLFNDFSLLSEDYFGKEAIAGFLPKDFVLSPDGFFAEVKGRFFAGDNVVYRLECEGASIWIYGDRPLSIDDHVSVAPRCFPKLFDPINERSIVRY